MSEQNFDPEIIVSWTNDGGHSWEGFRQVSIGQQGYYDKEVRLNRLGTSSIHGRAYRVEFSAARPFTLIGAIADVDVLRV